MLYIATSHGPYAEGCVQTLKMLTGDEILAVSFLDSMSKEDLKKQFLYILEENPTESYVFFVDIFGGTPFNVLVEIKYEYPQYHISVVTGLSLLMLMGVLEEGYSEEVINNINNNIHIVDQIEFTSQSGEEED